MRPILSLMLALAAMMCHAQVDLINRTVIRRDSSFIFEGMTNELVVTGTAARNWQLKARNAGIWPTDSSRVFAVRSYRIGADTFSLLQNGKVVLKKVFNVISSGNPVLRWGTLKTDTATTTEIIANKRMVMLLPGADHCPCRIVSFEIGFITAQSIERTNISRIEGNVLTPEAAGQISKLIHGDKVVFGPVRVNAFDGRTREIPGFTIVIK